MEPIEIIVTKDVKRAAIRETLQLCEGAVATLCYTQSTGLACVRVIGAEDEIDEDVVQVVDLSETDAYGSYIDSIVDPDTRLRVIGHSDILALWGTDDDTTIEQLVDDYQSTVELGADADWDTWVIANGEYLYTIDDAAFDLWEMIVEDIEYDGRYVVVDEE